MPRPGGEADKFGNRYESLWVVDAALDIIDGDYSDLVLEPVGDEAAGVEFFRTNPSGTREYHSIKRQQAGGNWTISRLAQRSNSGRSILGDLMKKILAGADGVFSSGTSASELEELTGRAQASESIEEFEKRISGNGQFSGRFQDCIIPMCGGKKDAYFALRKIRVRTKNEPELTKDVERRVRSMFRMHSGQALNAKSVRLLMAEFTSQKLGTPLRADSFLLYLAGEGIVPSQLADDSTASQQLQKLNRSYLSEVNRFLINQAEINRRESKAAYRVLLEEGKSVMLEATAGGGKSCVLAQIVNRLNDHDIPTLVIRLDRLTEADNSAQAIGTMRGLPDSPTITLGEFAGNQPSVLCLDQLDALSIVSARQQSAWGAFQELLEEARNYPNMRILFACRSFDLEQDPGLRSLATDEDRVERMQIEELDEEAILSAIKARNLEVEPLDDKQMGILQVPLHLYLFLEVAPSGKPDFTSRGDLFDAFWEHKAKRVRVHLAGQDSAWTSAIATLCDAMSERESLTAPVYVMDDHREALDEMASEAVVYIQGDYIRFFHETFFDYSFARTFLRANRDLVQWLVSDEQHLFRRSQVRQVLAFLRDREYERIRYLSTLRSLLGHADVRFHIKKLVLDWLGAILDPTGDEWRIIEGLTEELKGHVWGVVHNSVPWFDLLQGIAMWRAWLNGDDEQQVDRVIGLLRAPRVLDARSTVVATLIAPFQGQSGKWRARLRKIVAGYGYSNPDSPEMEDLVITLIADGTLDDGAGYDEMGRDWWEVWYGLSSQKPAFVARVIGAWFDRQVHLADELGRSDPFSGSAELINYSQCSEDVIKNCAKGAPRELVRELFPRYLRLDKRTPKKWISAPTSSGNTDEQLREGLAEAMKILAKDDPTELDSIITMESLSESKWMSSIFLRAWSANPGFYADRIAGFLLELPSQRLDLEYDISWGGDTFVAVSRTAVAAASSICSDELFAALESAILDLSPDWEQEAKCTGRTELALLRALDKKRLSRRARRRINQLERRFPKVMERGAPQPLPEDPGFRPVESPVSEEDLRNMSDDQLLAAMLEYPDESPSFREGRFVGDAAQLSGEIAALARKDPERFVALMNRMDTRYQPIYFGAILRALARGEEGSVRTGSVDQACSILRRIRDLGVPVRGAEVAWAVDSLAGEGPSSDIVQMVCQIALEDPDPPEDNWQLPDTAMDPISQAINSARGAAAETLARLLFADRSRWEMLKSTVEQIIVDPVLAVRSVAVECLLAVLDTNRTDALTGFGKLCTGADSIFGTHFVRRFVSYAIFRDYQAVKPILLRMLKSSEPAAVRAAGSHVAAAALWMEEARGDEESALKMGEEARAGAALVYAKNIVDATVGTECEKRLQDFFADESEAVRKEASRCWSILDPDEIALRGSLIGAFVQSAGSSNDMKTLVYRLEGTRRHIPVQVCDLAEYAIKTYGSKASSLRFAEGGAATMLAKLVVRLHEETDDPMLRKRILNVIDKMAQAGFMGIDEQLKQHYDR